MDPEITPYWFIYNCYLIHGEDLKAVEALQKAIPDKALTIKEVYNKSGIKGILNWLLEGESNKTKPNPFYLAGNYSQQGKKDEALSYLEKALKENLTYFPGINNDPNFDNLRSEPRFQAIIKKWDYQNIKRKSSIRQAMKEMAKVRLAGRTMMVAARLTTVRAASASQSGVTMRRARWARSPEVLMVSQRAPCSVSATSATRRRSPYTNQEFRGEVRVASWSREAEKSSHRFAAERHAAR